MKKIGLFFLIINVFFIFLISIAYAQEETVFSGNLRLGYVNMKDTNEAKFEDSFSIHFLELMVKKKVGDFGVFLNERIGDGNANYLYEGWVSYTIPQKLGMLKLGLIPVPFGIYSNGLYYPKGIPFDRNWMWEQDYGFSYTGDFQQSDFMGFSLEAAYLNKENGASELSAFNDSADCSCVGERDTVSGRLGINLGLEGLLELKAGGSAQFGKLNKEKALLVMKTGEEKAGEEGKSGDLETAIERIEDDKLGFAGDITISPKIFIIPVSLIGEFINYSYGEWDISKGNIIMAQADITPIQKFGMLDKATLSFNMGMEMPKEGKTKTNLIGQLLLQLDNQFLIFAQIFGDKYEGDDEITKQGLRIWFMYLF